MFKVCGPPPGPPAACAPCAWRPGDGVISMDRAVPDGYVLVVTENGYGKVTPVDEYPKQHRAGSGVRTFKIVEKTGDITAFRVVTLSSRSCWSPRRA